MVSHCYMLNISIFQSEDLTLLVCTNYVIKYKEVHIYSGFDTVMRHTWLSDECLKAYWEFQIFIGLCQCYNHDGYRGMEYLIECDTSQWLAIRIQAEKCTKEIMNSISIDMPIFKLGYLKVNRYFCKCMCTKRHFPLMFK